MFIRKDKVNDELVISIRGDISEKSEELFNQLLESDLEPSFVFDLGKVQMINSMVWPEQITANGIFQRILSQKRQ